MRRYDSYKDSGVEWLGDVPSHWELKRLKQLFVEKKHKQNLSLNCGAISFGKVIEKDDDKVTEATKRSYQEVLKGEFLINPLNLNYDLISLRIALSEIDVVVSAGYIVLKAKQIINKKYFSYLLHRYDVAYMKLLGSGVRQTINYGHISDSILVAPPLSEQQKIAQFLDDKTAKIDQAVDLAEKQIALLKEHKQILIQNAVTRGLNPDVPLKDSGVEWIGQVPEHWEVSSLGKILLPVSEKNKPNLPLLSITRELGVIERDVEDQESNHNFIPDDLSNYKVLKEGQFGMNKMKAWQGSYGVSRFTGIVSPAYYIFDFIKSVNSRFFHLAIRSKIYISFFGSASDGVRIGQWDLSKSRMKSIPFIIPSYTEQVQIADYLDQQAVKIDQAIALKTAHIEKLKEYKSVLINDVVTGKVRV